MPPLASGLASWPNKYPPCQHHALLPDSAPAFVVQARSKARNPAEQFSNARANKKNKREKREGLAEKLKTCSMFHSLGPARTLIPQPLNCSGTSRPISERVDLTGIFFLSSGYQNLGKGSFDGRGEFEGKGAE